MKYVTILGGETKQRCRCGKVCFDKRGAQTKKNELEREGQGDLRIYPCPKSNGAWHLTSLVRHEYDFE